MKAATWYVDGSASGSANGKSWASAWTSLQQISGLSAGDTVYISGGPKGSSQTYNLSGPWSTLTGGTLSQPITYQIGQDSAHNGTAVFNCAISGQQWLPETSNIVITGNAGDGTQHFKITGFTSLMAGWFISNIQLSYLYADNLNTIGDFNPVTGLEVDHGFFKISDLNADHAIYANVQGTTWDDSLFHDNTVYVPNSGDGAGADALQLNGNGVSIYNNTIIGYVSAYTGSQHQDGWQGTGNSSYIKIYNNYFQDIANYPIFADAYWGGFSHLRIYNNIMQMSNAAMQSTYPPRGIVVIPDGGVYGNLGYYPAFTDIEVCNNLIADYGEREAIDFANNTGQSSVFTNCVMENNVIVNSGPLLNDTGVTTANNLVLTSAQAALDFVTYSTLSSTNNFRLTTAGIAALSNGIDLSTLFTTDMDGNTRTSWTSGPYSAVATLASTVTSTLVSTVTSTVTSTSTASTATSSSPLAPQITSATSVQVAVGAFLNYGIYASNNPTSFNATGTFPPGVSLDSLGNIRGWTTTNGTYTLTISATNSYGTASATLVITVGTGSPTASSSSATASSSASPLAPSITSSTSTSIAVGSFLNYGIYASNNPTSFNATGALPPGTSLDSLGNIRGFPTTAGSYSVTISASNSYGTGSAILVITVVGDSSSPVVAASTTSSASTSSSTNSALAPTITSPTATSVALGSFLNYGIYASNNPTSFSATGSLPPGTALDSQGNIRGYTTTAGTYPVTISATNAYGTSSANLVITVAGAGQAPAITSSTTATVAAGNFLNYGIYASNNPTSFNAVGSFPPGTSLDSMGNIRGYVTAPGTYNLTISATNAAGTATANLVVTVTSY